MQVTSNTAHVRAKTNANARVKTGIPAKDPATTTRSERDAHFASGPATKQVPFDPRAQVTVPGEADPALLAQLHAGRAGQVMGRGNGGRGLDAHGLNQDGGQHRTASGRIPSRAWDNPAEIVGHLTQNPAGANSSSSPYRCGPANLLSARLMNGPESGARFLEQVADDAGRAQLSSGERGRLRTIAGNIRGRSATYEELSEAQDLLYRAGNTRTDVSGAISRAMQSERLSGADRSHLELFQNKINTGAPMYQRDLDQLSTLLTRANGEPTRAVLAADPRAPRDHYIAVEVSGQRRGTDASGFRDDELRGLTRTGGGSGRLESVDFAAAHPLEDVLGRLQPGESATVRISGREDNPAPDHYITLGRQRDGTAYLYNSDPSAGDYTLFTGRPGQSQPEGFVEQLREYEYRVGQDSIGTPPAIVF